MDYSNIMRCFFTVTKSLNQKMSKKIYIGMLIGVAAGTAVSILLIYKNKKTNFWNEESSYENEMLDNVNNYLLDARDKVEEMVKEAEEKSDKFISEAGKNLALIKEKTSEMHSKIAKGYIDEAMKIKNEMEKIISDFKESLK